MASYALTAFRSCSSVGGGSATLSSRSRSIARSYSVRGGWPPAASGTADASADVTSSTAPSLRVIGYLSCASTSSK